MGIAVDLRGVIHVIHAYSGASCRDRTDDLPLTRRPLWPSELRRPWPFLCHQQTTEGTIAQLTTWALPTRWVGGRQTAHDSGDGGAWRRHSPPLHHLISSQCSHPITSAACAVVTCAGVAHAGVAIVSWRRRYGCVVREAGAAYLPATPVVKEIGLPSAPTEGISAVPT